MNVFRSARRHVLQLFVSLSVFIVLPTRQVEAEHVDLVSLVPPGAESVVWIRDVPGTLELIQKSAFFKFYNNPDAGDFLEPLRKTMGGRAAELVNLLSTRNAENLGALNGGLIVARWSSPSEKDKPKPEDDAYLVIYDYDGRADALAPFLEREVKKGEHANITEAEAYGFKYERRQWTREVRKEQYEPRGKRSNERLSGLTSSPGVRRARHLESEEELRYVGKRLVIRAWGGQAIMESALKRLREPGKHLSLASDADRKGAVSGFDEPPQIEIYYDFQALARGGKGWVDESLLGRDGDISKLGLNEIKTGALGMFLKPDRMFARVNVYAPPPREGIGKLLFINEPLIEIAEANVATTPTTARAAMLRAIPNDALGYAVYRADLPQVWSDFRRIFRESIPAASQLVDSYLKSLSEAVDADLEKELVSKLGSHWGMFTRPGPRRGRKEKIETTYMLEIRPGTNARATVEKWLKKVATTLNYQLDQSEVGKNVYYRLNGAEVSEGAYVDLEQFAKFCLADDRWLFISPRFEAIQAAVKKMETPEKESNRDRELREGRERALAQLPADRFFEAYSAPTSFTTIANDPFIGIFGGALRGIGGEIIALDETPNDDLWRFHFGATSASLRATEDQIQLTLQLLYAGNRP